MSLTAAEVALAGASYWAASELLDSIILRSDEGRPTSKDVPKKLIRLETLLEKCSFNVQIGHFDDARHVLANAYTLATRINVVPPKLRVGWRSWRQAVVRTMSARR